MRTYRIQYSYRGSNYTVKTLVDDNSDVEEAIGFLVKQFNYTADFVLIKALSVE